MSSQNDSSSNASSLGLRFSYAYINITDRSLKTSKMMYITMLNYKISKELRLSKVKNMHLPIPAPLYSRTQLQIMMRGKIKGIRFQRLTSSEKL